MKTKNIEEGREKEHIRYGHLFFGVSLAVIYFMLLFAGVGVVSAHTVNLISPENNIITNLNNNSLQFIYNHTGTLTGIVNCILYLDGNPVNYSIDVPANTSQSVYSNQSWSEGTHYWYVNCTNGTSQESSLDVGQNYTFTADFNCTDEGSDGIADGIVTVCRDTSCYCRCDGTDDHVEINQAISYINSIGGGTVHLKAGTYIINDSINILSNVIFEGDSQDSTIIKLKDQNNRANWNLIYGDGVTNCILQNFTLDGNRGNQSGVDQNDNIDGIHFSHSDNITVQYVTSKNQMTDNFEFTSTRDSIVRYCTAKDSSHDGFRAGACDRITFADNLAWNLGAHGVRFYNTKNSIVERNKLYAGDYGILEQNEGGVAGNNIFRDNYIDNTKFANYAAICIEVADDASIENDVFIRNMLDTCWSHGFHFKGYAWGTGEFKNIEISNNVINKMGGSGIYVEPDCNVSGIVAKNNIIVNNGARHNEGYGIYGNVTSEYNNIGNNVNGSYGGGASAGIGDISEDPLFANPAVWNENITGGVSWDWSKMMEYYTPQEDFHLKSQAGRWNGSAWVKDNETSPCIDAGDPSEKDPDGTRINMGAYGGTWEASKSPGATTSTLSGTVTDGTNPIEGALIKANSHQTTTNSTGGYTITLPAGNYTLTASKTGYQTQSKSAEVLENQITELNFTLAPIQLYLNIKTLKDNYQIGEIVNLTDPSEKEGLPLFELIVNLIRLLVK